MARSRFIPNLLYGTLGLAVAGAATYYTLRALRNRRESDEGSMLSVRRASRKTGRAVKQTTTSIGRGIEDTGERLGDAITDVGDELQSREFGTPLNRV